MVREITATGATIEEAKEAALKRLEVNENEDVKFEIIDIPQKKTFGLFGGCPARVRAYIEITPGTRAQAYLEKIIGEMGLENVTFERKEDEESVEITLTGQNLGMLIGHRGETLDALQYLTGLVVNRTHQEDYRRVLINVGDYREKREKALITLANRISKQALRYKRNQILEPMNPYERRIIHNAVQEVEGVESWSIGDGGHRSVVIGNRENTGDWNKNRPSKRPPRWKSDEGNYKANKRPGNYDYPKKESRSPKEDHTDTPLYGKLDANPKPNKDA